MEKIELDELTLPELEALAYRFIKIHGEKLSALKEVEAALNAIEDKIFAWKKAENEVKSRTEVKFEEVQNA